jgi:drug/metabolite transporter superfamily protein YnfA
MNLTVSLLMLLLAAVLEAGGDALVRAGLHASPLRRAVLFAAGALVLFGYSYAVNAPPWDFGRLLGIYVVFFFVAAQAIAWLFFHQRPAIAVWIGGAFIVTGGAIMTLAR